MVKLTKKQIEKIRKKEERKLWKEIRQVVLDRDKCCLLCGSNYKLNVHHILEKEFIIFRHLRFDIRNLVTVCPRCHKFGEFSIHRNPLYALERIKVLLPSNYKFLIKEANRLHEEKNKQ